MSLIGDKWHMVCCMSMAPLPYGTNTPWYEGMRSSKPINETLDHNFNSQERIHILGKRDKEICAHGGLLKIGA